VSIDAAISTLVQETLSPAAIHVAFAVQQEIQQRIDQTEALRQKHFEQTQYEAELARRRYLKVDPDNRLVADSLEADWNEKLRILHQVQQEHDQQRKCDQQAALHNDPDHLMSIVHDFIHVWNNPSVPALERKRIIAYLIEDVTLIKKEHIELQVRFRGGKTQQLIIPRPVSMALVRKTKPEVIEALEQLLDTYNDQKAALKLNEMGYTNWKGEQFTIKKVTVLRQTYGLKSRFERLREQGFLTGDEMAQKLGVCTTTVHALGREGLLNRKLYGNNKRCLYAAIPDDIIFQKGQGGRRKSKPAQFITVQSTTQDAT
jgi:DNA-binding XRE family transcriptional regulator